MVVLSAKSKLNDQGKVSDRGYFVESRERHKLKDTEKSQEGFQNSMIPSRYFLTQFMQ